MRTDVSFESAGLQLAGHLHLPEPGDGQARPAVVVGHPGAGVKEQAAGLYARRLADQGFIALAFDAAFQGESEGEPRGLEDPAHRVEDLKAAVSFLSVHPAVDPRRIGVLGLCASGGYAGAAAATDHRIRAVATVSGVDVGRQFRNGPDGAQPPGAIQQMIAQASAARTQQARGEPAGALAIFPTDAEQAHAAGPHAFEGYDYYRTARGEHPRAASAFAWPSVDRIAGFDAFRFIDLIAPRPLLLIAGNRAVTAWMASEAYILAREPKELVWIEGASHVDLYDREPFVSEAIGKLADFFRESLQSASGHTPESIEPA